MLFAESHKTYSIQINCLSNALQTNKQQTPKKNISLSRKQLFQTKTVEPSQKNNERVSACPRRYRILSISLARGRASDGGVRVVPSGFGEISGNFDALPPARDRGRAAQRGVRAFTSFSLEKWDLWCRCGGEGERGIGRS